MPLAQLNIAQWIVDPMSENAAFFFDNVTRVNAIAEESPGFLWRFMEPSSEEERTVFNQWDRDGFIINASVWETPEDLEHFVWNTIHKRIYDRKESWFAKPAEQRFVMWPVAPGHTPSLMEAKEKLALLNERGDSDDAFGWQHLRHLTAWKKGSGTA